MADPLTMTPEREASNRRVSASWTATMADIAAETFAELDATRAKLAEAEARVAALTEAGGRAVGAMELLALEAGGLTSEERSIYATWNAALSPSQDAKGGA